MPSFDPGQGRGDVVTNSHRRLWYKRNTLDTVSHFCTRPRASGPMGIYCSWMENAAACFSSQRSTPPHPCSIAMSNLAVPRCLLQGIPCSRHVLALCQRFLKSRGFKIRATVGIPASIHPTLPECRPSISASITNAQPDSVTASNQREQST